MPHPEDQLQNINTNQHQEQQVNTNDWEIINRDQVQELNQQEDQHPNFINVMGRNTVLEKDAQIDFKSAERALTRQQRKDMVDKLKTTTPEQIQGMSFGELVVWAKESATIESGSQDYLALTNQLSKVDQMRKEANKLMKDNQDSMDLRKATINEIASLADKANHYVVTHTVWNKAAFHKGKCRLALARRVLKEKDMVFSLNMIPLKENGYKLSSQFSLESVAVLKHYTDDIKCYQTVGRTIRECGDKNKVELYKKLTKDIDGSFERSQFLELFKGTYTEKGYTIRPEEEAQVTEALRQYYDKTNPNVRPLFNIIDQRARELLEIKFNENYFSKENIMANPHSVHKIGYSVGARCGNLFAFNKPLGKAYLADLKKRNPSMAKALEDKCDLLAMSVAEYPRAVTVHFGVSIIKASSNAMLTDDILEDLATNGAHYLTYPMQVDADMFGYMDEDGNYQLFGPEHFYDNTMENYNNLKNAAAGNDPDED